MQSTRNMFKLKELNAPQHNATIRRVVYRLQFLKHVTKLLPCTAFVASDCWNISRKIRTEMLPNVRRMNKSVYEGYKIHSSSISFKLLTKLTCDYQTPSPNYIRCPVKMNSWGNQLCSHQLGHFTRTKPLFYCLISKRYSPKQTFLPSMLLRLLPTSWDDQSERYHYGLDFHSTLQR